ncbi:hypothetical protein EV175_001906 [Coemansia sp. RSA 1933]|nr:hypothetical protein EV175_001906 [Coemansia sp. RSA 1933]
MATASRMQTAIDEIRRSRNWITQIVTRKKQEQQTMLLSPPIHEAGAAVAGDNSTIGMPLQQMPPPIICHVQRHMADDVPIDEERVAAKQQLKYHTDRQSMETVDGGGSFAETPADLNVDTRALELDMVGIVADDPTVVGQKHRDSDRRRKVKLFMFALTQSMLFLFIIALGIDIRSKTESPVLCHPLLMGAMLVLSTEATVVLQYAVWPFPAGKKLKYRVFHTALQCIAMVVGTVGIGECIYRRKGTRAKNQEATEGGGGLSGHGCIGRLVIFAFFIQLGFGMYMRVSPTLVGNRQQSKQYLIKYHRALGYVVLMLLWLSAWLGVHNPQWMAASSSKVGAGLSNWVWVFVFAGLSIGILVPLDRTKFGFR